MNDELIEITRKELGNTLSKIFSAIPENTQFNISQFEMAGIIDSLFKTHGPSREIVPLRPDAAFLSSDLANELSENKSFEYTTLEEVTADKGLNIKYLLRGALQGKYLLYHIHGCLWWPVPVTVLNDLYNGKEHVSSKIWSISDRNWLPVELVSVEPLDDEWGKTSKPVKKVSLTIASLHIREDDLKKIIKNPSLLEEDQFYKSDELQLAVACSRELYPTKPPEASTLGEKKTNAQPENKKINEWLQRNGVEVQRKCDRIRVMVNPYTD